MLSNKEQTIIDKLAKMAEENNHIEPDLYKKYEVKRGLRNENGTGVLVGLTSIAEVHGYIIVDGEKVPDTGNLTYRGIPLRELCQGFLKEKRFGFEETIYLLMFGSLPNKEELQDFNEALGNHRNLPDGFVENMILKNPSTDIMNKIQRSLLVSYSYDNNPDDISIRNITRQSLDMIAKMPAMVAYGYQAKQHYFNNASLYIHAPKKEYSTAENILHMIRPDNKFTAKEAELLDLCLVIHAEHGGGNNSAFTTYVVSSSGTDTYAALSAAVGALKGPKHGGANRKVLEMMADIMGNVEDWQNDTELYKYLMKIVKKDAFDQTGLIYGMGHAIYTSSDPRAEVLEQKALELAEEKGRVDEFKLYQSVERLTKQLFKELKGEDFAICANVDFYSGLVYDMLNIPGDLYTPIFAVARTAGWCAHRIEQLISEQKIIRPAYKSVSGKGAYIPMDSRK
ncbi:citrate/2-methylcitrate synthase [Clostridia bacterium]|nr:citrate/2-methylcitrate synthase [Clostridia bacterium]